MCTAGAQQGFPARLLPNQLHTSLAIVAMKMGSIFTATLLRSSELNRGGRVIIGASRKITLQLQLHSNQKQQEIEEYRQKKKGFCLLFNCECYLM